MFPEVEAAEQQLIKLQRELREVRKRYNASIGHDLMSPQPAIGRRGDRGRGRGRGGVE